MFFIYRPDILRVNQWWKALAVGSIVAACILAATVFGADRTKLAGISIFGNPTVVYADIEGPRLEHENTGSITARLLHNRIAYAITTIYDNYLASYGPEFLFIKGGGNSAHNIKGYGNLHAFEAPFLLLGIAWLISVLKKKESKFILWWIAVGGIAAAITKDAPHSNRMLMVVPALAVAVAAGITQTGKLAKRYGRLILNGAIIVLIAGYAASMLRYVDLYYTHFPRNETKHWGYGYKELTSVLFSPEYRDKQVIMTRPETSPYIYLLFYSGYSPARYQKEAKRYPTSTDGFTDVSGFGRFSFRPIIWEKDMQKADTLLVSYPDDIPDSYRSQTVHTVTLPDGTVQFMVLASYQ